MEVLKAFLKDNTTDIDEESIEFLIILEKIS